MGAVSCWEKKDYNLTCHVTRRKLSYAYTNAMYHFFIYMSQVDFVSGQPCTFFSIFFLTNPCENIRDMINLNMVGISLFLDLKYYNKH